MEHGNFEILVAKIDEMQKDVIGLKSELSKFKDSIDEKFKNINKKMKKNGKDFKKEIRETQNLFDTKVENLRHSIEFTNKKGAEVPWEDTLDGMSMAAVGGIPKNLGSTSDAY